MSCWTMINEWQLASLTGGEYFAQNFVKKLVNKQRLEYLYQQWAFAIDEHQQTTQTAKQIGRDLKDFSGSFFSLSAQSGIENPHICLQPSFYLVHCLSYMYVICSLSTMYWLKMFDWEEDEFWIILSLYVSFYDLYNMFL